MAEGLSFAQEAIEHFTDWEVVQAMERMWAAATADEEDRPPDRPTVRAPHTEAKRAP